MAREEEHYSYNKILVQYLGTIVLESTCPKIVVGNTKIYALVWQVLIEWLLSVIGGNSALKTQS